MPKAEYAAFNALDPFFNMSMLCKAQIESPVSCVLWRPNPGTPARQLG
jgi:hypothetical protein